MEIVVRGRNVEVPDHYRQHVAEKLGRIERYDHKVTLVDVELFHERNPRQSSACQHVEITCRSRGPVIRAEGCAGDFYAALDAAATKLETRFRKAKDRRGNHHGHHRRPSVADMAGKVDAAPAEVFAPSLNGHPATESVDTVVTLESADGGEPDTENGRIVRRKEHSAAPMTVDQALHNMELVGHDFYLFADVETGMPSVVYRRKGFAYGVIHLTPEAVAGAADAAADAAGRRAASAPV